MKMPMNSPERSGVSRVGVYPIVFRQPQAHNLLMKNTILSCTIVVALALIIGCSSDGTRTTTTTSQQTTTPGPIVTTTSDTQTE